MKKRPFETWIFFLFRCSKIPINISCFFLSFSVCFYHVLLKYHNSEKIYKVIKNLWIIYFHIYCLFTALAAHLRHRFVGALWKKKILEKLFWTRFKKIFNDHWKKDAKNLNDLWQRCEHTLYFLHLFYKDHWKKDEKKMKKG